MLWKAREIANMQLAFNEAQKVKGQTLPNPPVGAVIVRHGKIVGQGGTQPAGQAHAEIMALRQAREDAQGATLFVTLEPCRHFGKTPPCTKAIINAGIRRVVVACKDPNPKMSGKSFAELRQAGIEVDTGLGSDFGEIFYEGFFFFIREGRAKIILKIAQSLDGRINARPKIQTPITNNMSLSYCHALRARADGILIGGQTLRSDNPLLTPRYVSGPSPEALVLTRMENLDLKFRLFAEKQRKISLITSSPTYPLKLPKHVEICSIPKSDKQGGLPLARALLGVFKQKGHHLVLVEGGRSVWSPFLNHGLCDELKLFTAPIFLPEGERWAQDLNPTWVKFLEFHRFTGLKTDALFEFRRG